MDEQTFIELANEELAALGARDAELLTCQ